MRKTNKCFVQTSKGHLKGNSSMRTNDCHPFTCLQVTRRATGLVTKLSVRATEVPRVMRRRHVRPTSTITQTGFRWCSWQRYKETQESGKILQHLWQQDKSEAQQSWTALAGNCLEARRVYERLLQRWGYSPQHSTIRGGEQRSHLSLIRHDGSWNFLYLNFALVLFRSNCQAKAALIAQKHRQGAGRQCACMPKKGMLFILKGRNTATIKQLTVTQKPIPFTFRGRLLSTHSLLHLK